MSFKILSMDVGWKPSTNDDHLEWVEELFDGSYTWNVKSRIWMVKSLLATDSSDYQRPYNVKWMS